MCIAKLVRQAKQVGLAACTCSKCLLSHLEITGSILFELVKAIVGIAGPVRLCMIYGNHRHRLWMRIYACKLSSALLRHSVCRISKNSATQRTYN